MIICIYIAIGGGPDSVALEATKNSKKISIPGAPHQLPRRGGRASYRPGHSTGARRLNRLSALNEDKTPEEAAQLAADIAAQSHKRAIERFGPDAVKKREGGAAAPPRRRGRRGRPRCCRQRRHRCRCCRRRRCRRRRRRRRPAPAAAPRPPRARPRPRPWAGHHLAYQLPGGPARARRAHLGPRGPAAIEALLAGRRAAAADNAAA
eukprot:tig00020965_g16848.t1